MPCDQLILQDVSDQDLRPLTKGRFVARVARSPADVTAAQQLRALCFGRVHGHDRDAIDTHSTHVLIQEGNSGTLVCCFRLLALEGAHLPQSYAAQYYDLTALQTYPGLMMELGRFCAHPDWHDPDILRVAWAMMTRMVDARDVQMLFGCSSFAGVDPNRYLDAFAVLKARYLAPETRAPQIKAPEVFRFGAQLRCAPDLRKGMAQMPPLLRTYLSMGGWVSDHAVIDRHMNTLHVFTGLEIAMIPKTRKRLLRALV